MINAVQRELNPETHKVTYASVFDQGDGFYRAAATVYYVNEDTSFMHNLEISYTNGVTLQDAIDTLAKTTASSISSGD